MTVLDAINWLKMDSQNRRIFHSKSGSNARHHGTIYKVRNIARSLLSALLEVFVTFFAANYFIKVVEKSGHPDFPPVRSHRAQLRQWAQDRVVHFSEREAILFTYVTAIH